MLLLVEDDGVIINPMKFSEAMKSVTADELNAILDANMGALEAETGESEHLVEWLAREYPELVDFAHSSVGRYFEDPSEVQPEVVHLVTMNTAITLGAICRILEDRELLR